MPALADRSAIEWTDATWNPLLGCTKVSAGCAHCYAEKFLARWRDMPPGHRFSSHLENPEPAIINERGEWTGKVRVVEKAMDLPLRWQRPRRVFVNSLSDLFHEDVPDAVLDRIFRVMQEARQHTFQVLTKRPERAAEYLSKKVPVQWGGYTFGKDAGMNIWVGTSVENQQAAHERIPHLLRTPAAVRFLSCEPLLGPVDLARWLPRVETWGPDGTRHYVHPVNTNQVRESQRLIAQGKAPGYAMKPEETSNLHWVIAGGESGPDARPMHPTWARQLRDQCKAANVAFFFKQWGDWLGMSRPFPPEHERVKGDLYVWDEQHISVRVGKKRAMRWLDDVEHSAYPVVPA